MNYREKIREAIECPEFGYKGYGKWGILNLEQRKLIKRLLDELDSADNCVKKLYLENKQQKEVIDKIKNMQIEMPKSNYSYDYMIYRNKIDEILKEVS